MGAAKLRAPRTHVDATKLISYAMDPKAGGSYIAQVETTVRYAGRTVRSRAMVAHSGERERVEQLNGDARGSWSLTEPGRSYTYLPTVRTLLITETGRVLSEREKTRLLLANYEAQYQGTEQVAGRDAYVVRLAPRRGEGPSKTLWIDRRRHNVLRSTDYGASGDERGGTKTLKIAYDVRPDAARMDPAHADAAKKVFVCKSTEPAALAKALGLPVRLPKHLPKGYALDGYHLFNSQCNCGHRSAQLTFTDGLNVISVFETPRDSACRGANCDMASAGGVNACTVQGCDAAQAGRIVRSDRTVVVVADLPAREIRRIVESVQ